MVPSCAAARRKLSALATVRKQRRCLNSMPRSVDIFSARHYSRGPCAGTAHHRSLDTVGAGSSDADAMSWKRQPIRSEEHTSELQSLMRISYAVFCLKKKK